MQNNKPITTSELAKILNTSNKVILENAKKCLPNKIIENGKHTYWSQEEITLLLDGIKSNHNNQYNFTAAVKGINTELTPILKLQKLQAEMQIIYEEENRRLQEENSQQKEVIIDFKLTTEKRVNKDKLFTSINNLIREKAQLFFNNNYSNAYNYYYQELSNRHCFNYSISMQWLKKNLVYAKELLEILLIDNTKQIG